MTWFDWLESNVEGSHLEFKIGKENKNKKSKNKIKKNKKK